MAVKIINHDKHVGNNFDAMRESVLCSNINHPNVVMTYKASLCRPSLWSGDTSPPISCLLICELSPLSHIHNYFSVPLAHKCMAISHADACATKRFCCRLVS